MEQKIRRDRNMGSNLRRLRDQYGISQEKLCAELQRRGCDIGRTAYAKYESGELNIRASVLIELRKIYSCSYDEFFAGLDTRKPIQLCKLCSGIRVKSAEVRRQIGDHAFNLNDLCISFSAGLIKLSGGFSNSTLRCGKLERDNGRTPAAAQKELDHVIPPI